MNEITVQLGGRAFVLPKLTIRAEAEWRRTARETMAPLLQAGEMANVQVATAADIARVVQQFGEWLNPLAVLETLIAYAPAVLGPEREWLEEHAYTDEVIGVLLSVFFTSTMPQQQRSMRNGSAPAHMPTT